MKRMIVLTFLLLSFSLTMAQTPVSVVQPQYAYKYADTLKINSTTAVAAWHTVTFDKLYDVVYIIPSVNTAYMKVCFTSDTTQGAWVTPGMGWVEYMPTTTCYVRADKQCNIYITACKKWR